MINELENFIVTDDERTLYQKVIDKNNEMTQYEKLFDESKNVYDKNLNKLYLSIRKRIEQNLSEDGEDENGEYPLEQIEEIIINNIPRGFDYEIGDWGYSTWLSSNC